MFLICGEALYDFFLTDETGASDFGIDARPGGSPFNVAIGMSRLGEASSLLTGLSDDMLGARLVRLLEAEKVGTDYLVRTDRRTTLICGAGEEPGAPLHLSRSQYQADH